jgi:hypothetical protein
MNQGIPGIPIFKGNINLYGNKKAIYFAGLVIIDLQESGPPLINTSVLKLSESPFCQGLP